MTTFLIIFNVLLGIYCWSYADNFPPGTIGWFLFLTFSAWNMVEAVSAMIGV